MSRSWKTYTAKIEAYREPNIFSGPLGEGDEFVHYYRDHEGGVDYFGVYTDDHTAWRAAQPDTLNLTAPRDPQVPPESPHIQLALRRIEERLPTSPTQEEVDASMAIGAEELAAKGLSIPDGWEPSV